MMLLEHQDVDSHKLGGLTLRGPLVPERVPGVDVQRKDAELAVLHAYLRFGLGGLRRSKPLA